jgi:sec-independent protein translocase protein TatA
MLSLIPLFLGGLRGSEIIIIALVILLLFGGRKIPELMRGLGKGVRSFRQGMKEVNDEINSDSSDEVSAKNSSEKR